MSTASSTPQPAHDAQAWPEDAVEVGRVMGAWGIKGGIKVKPFAADPQALFSSKRWYIQPPEGPRPAGLKPPASSSSSSSSSSSWPALLRVMTAKEHGDGVVATAHDLNDRDAAEALKGARIFVSRASFPTPDSDEFYWVDLIGLSVSNREAVALGTVIGLIETGPHCVLRVLPVGADAGDEAAERLIPFVDAYVDKVDLPAKQLTVDWDPEF